MKVLRSQVTETAMYEFVTEASSIGLKPGQWPEYLKTDIDIEQDFKLHHINSHNREIESVVYLQKNGAAQLTVFND